MVRRSFSFAMPRRAESPHVLALAIRTLRETLNLSQAGLGLQLGVCLDTVHRWETGRRTPPRQALYHLRSEIMGRPSWRRCIDCDPDLERLLLDCGLLPDRWEYVSTWGPRPGWRREAWLTHD
jgi:transcriptional regulator with XRE-family HTH domain